MDTHSLNGRTIPESELLAAERALAEAGYTKVRSEYVGLLYRAAWALGDEEVRFYQVEAAGFGSCMFEMWVCYP